MNYYIFSDSGALVPVSKFFQRLYFNQFRYKIQVVYQKILEKPLLFGTFLNIAQFICISQSFFSHFFNSSLAVFFQIAYTKPQNTKTIRSMTGSYMERN